MKRSTFIQTLLLLLTSPLFAKGKGASTVQLIRHATLFLQLNGIKILIDPMLSAKDEMDPVQNCGNTIRIPMVELPFTEKEMTQILQETDAIFLTHLHRDHWDAAAQKRIDKNKTIFCQPGDEVKLREQGFQNVNVIATNLEWKGIAIHRTGGHHGTGEIEKKMGTVSGFVLKTDGASIYIVGDTIWCDEIKNALTEFKPAVTVLNTGGAKFLTGDPITMTSSDVVKVKEHLPSTKIICVHMDTVNHCLIKRINLAEALAQKKIKVLIPKDGETLKV